ncbi:MAG: hypothetical protein FWC69_06405 [Defluviitaleaceae bacterium]|nr:hypothetical protein [Defluviitaleaceae bacterium]
MKLTKDNAFLILSILGGILWGVWRVFLLSEGDLHALTASLRHFVDYFDTRSISLASIGESLLRNGHTLVLVWICSKFPKLFWASYLLLYLKAMTLAFSITLMVQAFGAFGIIMGFALNLPQNILITAMCIYIMKKGDNNKKLIALAGLLALALACFYEVFLSAILFSMLI